MASRGPNGWNQRPACGSRPLKAGRNCPLPWLVVLAPRNACRHRYRSGGPFCWRGQGCRFRRKESQQPSFDVIQGIMQVMGPGGLSQELFKWLWNKGEADWLRFRKVPARGCQGMDGHSRKRNSAPAENPPGWTDAGSSGKNQSACRQVQWISGGRFGISNAASLFPWKSRLPI